MNTTIHDKLLSSFEAIADEGRLRFDEPMARHCSFEIGGPADAYIEPKTESELIQILIFAIQNSIPYMMIGKGSNLLISDNGLRCLVISTNQLKKISRDENCISAYAGVELGELCSFAMQAGLSGLEFASGIPGSVGGAVYMNAGAYGGEIKDVLYNSRCLSSSLCLLNRKQPVIHLKNIDHHFAYRHSALQDQGLIHLSSVFRLKPDDPELIKSRMDDLHDQRYSKQPMDLPSGGSVFKRPEGYFTGKLIDDCGLRGYRIGDAAISDKHCGFIVNMGNASYKDVVSLIRFVQNTVKERFGVKLETEIRIIGD